MALNKAEIINEINRLQAELPLVQKIAEIAEHEGLKLALDRLTEECCACVKSKCYKTSKDTIKTLEVINNFKEYLERQAEYARRIEIRLAEYRIDLTKCQLSLFEEENAAKINTGFEYKGQHLFTGDAFETSQREYLLISESEQTPNSYCITGTAFTEELLLQYPKNREILKGTCYLGNLFENDKLAEFFDKLTQKQNEIQEQTDDSDEEPEEDSE